MASDSAQHRFSTASAARDNPLTALIRRLEAATSRLEDIANSTSPEGTKPNAPQPAAVAAGSTSGFSGLPPAAPPAITALDKILNGELVDYVNKARAIGSPLADQAMVVETAFDVERRLLLTSTRAKKPDMTDQNTMPVLVHDLQSAMGEVEQIRSDARSAKEWANHLSMVAEGLAALQWLFVDTKPSDFIGEIIGGSQMYGNRVLMAVKNDTQKSAQAELVTTYTQLLKALQAYTKQYYPSGLTWNSSGVDAVQAYRETDASATPTPRGPSISGPSAGGPPPPPPPPPPLPTFDNVPSTPQQRGGGDMGAVFAQLNRGDAVTSGLKKVDKSQMTHKNPSLRAVSGPPDRPKSPGPGPAKPKPANMRQSPPKAAGKTELDGNKWLIANWDSPAQPIEIEVSQIQSVLVTNCKRTTIILRGKANAISIDNSPNVQMLVATLVSGIDVIKSSRFALQITDVVPTIALDQVDGATIYLGENSLKTEVFTSKCTGINVVVPEKGDSKECPVPEQIKSYLRNGELVSELVKHAG
ncbi:hypothetical protein K470DRAFT_245165 [Piedraia hortae CBS 480.64]|uniref:Adenylyl cyclase-associated protein n=1 Tax=Piedraia hortae CBS 480.64 TaxID=1314780 RepID=A0A6A7C2C8_9PEZI|nr:hypothetical protein K470DRAFT_245165 [Piedraia hortae CBS 480.64]